MKLQKLKAYFFQFRLLDAIRILCAELSRKVFDPYNTSSYSQIGEDRILEIILGETGFYVDVGCNHPQFYSNTFSLYKKGWVGITVDANQELIRKHQKLRKRDLSVCAVISDQEQEVTFTDFEDPFISSLDAEHISIMSERRSKIKGERVVSTVTLTSILDSCKAPQKFDLLCIDVEGHDFEVLSSLNLNIYRPKLIMIEMHEFDLLNPGSNRICEHLRVNNYKLIGYVVMNGYFLDVSQNNS